MSPTVMRNRTDLAIQEIARALPGLSQNIALYAGEAKRSADALERIEDLLLGMTNDPASGTALIVNTADVSQVERFGQSS